MRSRAGVGFLGIAMAFLFSGCPMEPCDPWVDPILPGTYASGDRCPGEDAAYDSEAEIHIDRDNEIVTITYQKVRDNGSMVTRKERWKISESSHRD